MIKLDVLQIPVVLLILEAFQPQSSLDTLLSDGKVHLRLSLPMRPLLC